MRAVTVSLYACSVLLRVVCLDLQSANAHPREEYILQRSCSDDWHLESSQLSCGKFHDGTEYVFDSQGFCCRCSALSILRFNEGIDNIRANHSCHLFGGVYASAHCLRFSDLWWVVPYLQLCAYLQV